MARGNPGHSVSWWAEGKKRPVARSTNSASLFIETINEPNRTARQLMERIDREYPYAVEERAVLQAYLDCGHGDEILKTRIY